MTFEHFPNKELTFCWEDNALLSPICYKNDRSKFTIYFWNKHVHFKEMRLNYGLVCFPHKHSMKQACWNAYKPLFGIISYQNKTFPFEWAIHIANISCWQTRSKCVFKTFQVRWFDGFVYTGKIDKCRFPSVPQNIKISMSSNHSQQLALTAQKSQKYDFLRYLAHVLPVPPLDFSMWT